MDHLTAKQAEKDAFKFHFKNNQDFKYLIDRFLTEIKLQKDLGEFSYTTDNCSGYNTLVIHLTKSYLLSLGYSVEPSKVIKTKFTILW